VKNAALAYTAPYGSPVSLAVAVLQEAAQGSTCRFVHLAYSMMIPSSYSEYQVVLVAVPNTLVSPSPKCIPRPWMRMH
jgi:hypothetical protein